MKLRRVGIAMASAGAAFCVLAALLPVNEYRAMGIGVGAGAYDCDGPTVVGALLVVGEVLGLMGVVALQLGRSFTRAAVLASAAAVLGLLLGATTIPELAREMARNAQPHSPCR